MSINAPPRAETSDAQTAVVTPLRRATGGHDGDHGEFASGGHGIGGHGPGAHRHDGRGIGGSSHDHARAHDHGHGHARAPAAVPMSLLRLSVFRRLAIAGSLSGLLWLMVLWAVRPIAG